MALYQNKTRKEDGNYDSGEPIKILLLDFEPTLLLNFLENR